MSYIITLINTLVKLPNSNTIIDQIKSSDKYYRIEINVDDVTPYDDIYYLEELSYRGRIYIATNLPKKTAYDILNKFNIDAFISNVISAEEPKAFTNNPNYFNYLLKITNLKTGYFITANDLSISVAKSFGLKTIFLDRDGKKSSVNSLKKLVEITSKSYVDSKIGDSALRCSLK
ncbi:HAD family hydrolase [Sulfolobus sp. A20-N-F8]|nr:HAD family hydrolase [Sulfolobus sp. A20-N-F8]